MHSPTGLELRSNRLATTALTLVLLAGFAPAPANAGISVDVQEILISVVDQRTAGVTDQWSFDIEILGSGITSISLVVPPTAMFPNGEMLDETDFEQDGNDWCLEIEFPDLAALQARFPNGTYSITINGNQANLSFNPTVPDGIISVSFPANNAMLPNGQPTFASTTTCTNCNLVEAIVEDNLGTIEIETNAILPTPLPSSYRFSDFGMNLGSSGPISSLPLATPLDFCTLESVITMSGETLGGVDAFSFVQERGADDRVSFTVTTPMLLSDIGEVGIAYDEFEDDWTFSATVEGSGIASAMVIPPNQAPRNMPILPPDELEFADGPFASEAAVRAAYPPTSGVDRYVIVIDGGERFYSASFAPGSPNGDINFVSPMNGATGLSSTPSFTVANTCTNCTAQFISIESTADEGVDIPLLSDIFPFPSTIDFADFDPNEGTLGPISELPAGEYLVDLDTTVETVFFLESFVPTELFDYFSGTFRNDVITVTVPEPGALTSQLLASLTLAALWRRRRSS